MEPNLSTVRSRLAEIEKLQKALDEEANDLRAAERALTRLAAMGAGANGGTAPKPENRSTAPSNEALILATLKTSPNVWFETAADLHEAIKTGHGRDIRKTTFQPLLSQLKHRGIVKRDGAKIALAARLRSTLIPHEAHPSV